MSTLHFPAIITAAVIGLLIDIALTALGIGVGLITIPLEDGGAINNSTLILAGITMMAIGLISFGTGGYIAGLFSQTNTRWINALHGLTSFALATIYTVTIAAIIALTSAGSIIGRAGLAAGAAVGTDAFVTELAKVRVLTDVSILKGKIVTRFVIPGSKEATLLDQTLKNAGDTVQSTLEKPEVKDKAEQIVETTRKGVAKAAMGLCAYLLIVAVFSSWTATLPGRKKK